MLNLLKSRKAEFFVVSTVAIVSIIFVLSKYMGPQSLTDTSSAVLNEPFIFDNIVEKAKQTVKISKNCLDLTYNLDEYKNFVESFYARKNIKVNINYIIVTPCDDNILRTKFYINLISANIRMSKEFETTK
ncbi:MAG: hypothetical protein NZ942_01645 [Candidatus Aenigmarchaeota archaeon]|nr:hypothetical protein [Candidatus Aenigmarchaeota archaeon]